MHFRLHHTAHCAKKVVAAHLRAGSGSGERMGQGEVAGKAVCALNGRLPTENADYCMLVNESAHCG